MAIRADKKRNVSKVAKAVIEKPLLTERQIAEEVGIGKSSVNRAMQELGQNGAKDPKIIEITDRDLRNIEAMQAVVMSKIAD